MALLFLELLNCTDRLTAPDDEGEHSTLVMTVLREIEENYRVANLTELSARCGVTVSYLSAAVHEATARPSRRCCGQAHGKGCGAFKPPRLPVGDIIAMVGYLKTRAISTAHFRKCTA